LERVVEALNMQLELERERSKAIAAGKIGKDDKEVETQTSDEGYGTVVRRSIMVVSHRSDMPFRPRRGSTLATASLSPTFRFQAKVFRLLVRSRHRRVCILLVWYVHPTIRREQY
jgi:hypothetical protein